MAQAIPALSTFHNHSVPELADILGQLDAEVKSLEDRMKAAKAELNARGVDRAEGSASTSPSPKPCAGRSTPLPPRKRSARLG